jgi:hypothetical protein
MAIAPCYDGKDIFLLNKNLASVLQKALVQLKVPAIKE